MLTELGAKLSVEHYYKLGGSLQETSFNIAINILLELKDGAKPKISKSSLAQADDMARFSQITITEEQRNLYAFLRDIMRQEEEGEPDILSAGVPIWALSDQELLAEVIRLTDKTIPLSFMSAYRHIFSK